MDIAVRVVIGVVLFAVATLFTALLALALKEAAEDNDD